MEFPLLIKRDRNAFEQINNSVILCCVFFFFIPMSLFAQGEKDVKEWMHVKVYLKNDSIVESYLHNSFGIGGYGGTRYIHEPCSSDSVMKLNDMKKAFSKDVKYNNREIDSMITWKDKYPQIQFKWEPQMSIFAYGSGDPIIEDYPVMLRVMYRGKHVTGYIINHFFFGYKCLYKTPDMKYAKTFINIEQKFSEKRRKTLLEEFGDYPEMEEYIKKLDKKAVKENPFAILEALDHAIGVRIGTGTPYE